MQTLTIKGLTIQVAEAALEQLVLERLRSDELVATVATIQPGFLPRVGADIAELGGIFAGVMRGRKDLFDGRDYYLVVGPEAPEELTWSAAGSWADGLAQHGFTDYTLFNRKEQALCFANVADLFKPEWYWSSEQHGASSSYAWGQHFSDGNQNGLIKDNDYRARAVRRVPIQ